MKETAICEYYIKVYDKRFNCGWTYKEFLSFDDMVSYFKKNKNRCYRLLFDNPDNPYSKTLGMSRKDFENYLDERRTDEGIAE